MLNHSSDGIKNSFPVNKGALIKMNYFREHILH